MWSFLWKKRQLVQVTNALIDQVNESILPQGMKRPSKARAQSVNRHANCGVHGFLLKKN